MEKRYNGEDNIVEGIAQAMADCLTLTRGDNIIVFYDNASVEPMEILVEAASRLGLREEQYNIDAYPRPLYEVPRDLRERLSMGGYEATFYVAGVKPGELAFR
ncbi:MAG: hypothetical protein GSR73_00255, partial [Desulfurococcales archaeon]|nr:hypothetical protein [Desulfurococcales archaeon]